MVKNGREGGGSKIWRVGSYGLSQFFLQFFFYNNKQTQSQERAPLMLEMPIVFANIVSHSLYLSIFETH